MQEDKDKFYLVHGVAAFFHICMSVNAVCH